jgi:hypothetical protein
MISVVLLLGPGGCFDCDEAMVKIHRMRNDNPFGIPQVLFSFQASSTAAVMNES